ncbi:hypothetical protein DDJ39_15080 [Mycobacteroides abscessus]|nr:hypothetical protein DDJ39_15080 [Mycobacteroides abscessus]
MPGCRYADLDGTTARAGRAQLRAVLTVPPHPLTDIEAGYAVRHVTDRLAALYALGAVVLGGLTDCADCGQWVPSFHATDPATTAVLEAGRCPRHP